MLRIQPLVFGCMHKLSLKCHQLGSLSFYDILVCFWGPFCYEVDDSDSVGELTGKFLETCVAKSMI